MESDALKAASRIASQRQKSIRRTAMSDLVERLRKLAERERPYGSLPDTLDEAAARIEQLEAALRGAESWLQNWAVHAGRCEGGNGCTCGLTAIRYDLSAALGERT